MDLGREKEAKDALEAAVADLTRTGNHAKALAARQLLKEVDRELFSGSGGMSTGSRGPSRQGGS